MYLYYGYTSPEETGLFIVFLILIGIATISGKFLSRNRDTLKAVITLIILIVIIYDLIKN
jgi:hypothetical protein